MEFDTENVTVDNSGYLRPDTAPPGVKIDEIIDFEILVDSNSKIYYQSNETGIIHF